MDKIACFIGHRKVDDSESLREKIRKCVENLIITENVTTFLFGSRSVFDTICYEIVSSLKQKYTNIKRVYVRAEYEFISENYKNYLLKNYEHTLYPSECVNSGKASYIKRNEFMIMKSHFCVFYYDEKYEPKEREKVKRQMLFSKQKSGTKQAFLFAKQKKKITLNVFE